MFIFSKTKIRVEFPRALGFYSPYKPKRENIVQVSPGNLTFSKYKSVREKTHSIFGRNFQFTCFMFVTFGKKDNIPKTKQAKRIHFMAKFLWFITVLQQQVLSSLLFSSKQIDSISMIIDAKLGFKKQNIKQKLTQVQ